MNTKNNIVVIFDMNGVIIDDEHVHEKAFSHTLKDHGIILTHNDYMMCCAGKTDRDGYKCIAQKFNVTLQLDEIVKEKFSSYFELFSLYKKAYNGVNTLIKELADHYILALTSSASRVEIDLILGDFDIAKYFSLTISRDDVTKGKPDPEPYIKTAHMLGVNPEACVVIEDSPSGVYSAKSAGCHCIAITTTHRREDLADADCIVDTFSQIDMDLINDIRG